VEEQPTFRATTGLAAVLALAAVPLGGLGCGWFTHSDSASPAAPSHADLEAIGRLRSEFVQATNEGDVDRLTALFADDAVFVPADDPTCEGKDAIADYFDDLMRDAPETIDLDVLETRVEGDWAFERLDVTIDSSDSESGEETETWARYFWVLKRQPGGGWKIDRAIYNIEEPDDEDDDGGTLRKT
jgi:uncharacterized protein (TIGR02246 family)